MVSQKVTVRNKSGLHLRPASELAGICGKFKCEISLKHPKGTCNPKSVLMLMGAGIGAGTEVEVICDGENEAEALEKVVSAIEGGFGEELVV